MPGEVTYTCPKEGGNLNILLDYDEIKSSVSPDEIFASKEQSLWRYLPLLPVSDPGSQGTPLRRAGWTPVYSASNLANTLGLRDLFIKDESPNPTASFKDRASSVVVARAREIGAEVVVTASTGNAGAALAGMAAAVNQQAVIFAPKSAPQAKIAQLLVFNAHVLLVDGNYDQAVTLALAASSEFGWYCRNTGYNPFTAEGKKTAAFEIWEFLNSINYKVQDNLSILVSVGDGNIISGIHKGFLDLKKLGWIEYVPRIIGVQSVGSAAIADAFFAGTEEIKPVSAKTLADSISVDMPSDGVRALRAATQTNGAYITVEDENILNAIAEKWLERCQSGYGSRT
jgi:threonine synthase